jgi:hypothetical protein
VTFRLVGRAVGVIVIAVYVSRFNVYDFMTGLGLF